MVEKRRKRRNEIASLDVSLSLSLPAPHALSFAALSRIQHPRIIYSPTDFFASATKEGRATGAATATRRAARPAFLAGKGAAAATGETFREAKAATGALAATVREEAARRATAGAEARTRRVVCMVEREREGERERRSQEEGWSWRL